MPSCSSPHIPQIRRPSWRAATGVADALRSVLFWRPQSGGLRSGPDESVCRAGCGRRRHIRSGAHHCSLRDSLSARSPCTAPGGAVAARVGDSVHRLFLLGMTHTGENRPPVWPDPHHYFRQFFLGDEVGSIRIDYADGAEGNYPLVLSESVWWGRLFYANPEPYPCDARYRAALAASLRLYPVAPVADGEYVAVIDPKPQPIRDITAEGAPAKFGVPRIDALTLAAFTARRCPAAPVRRRHLPAGRRTCAADGGCPRPRGRRRAPAAAARTVRERSRFFRPVPVTTPPGYAGPAVTFTGPVEAVILANAFRDNVRTWRSPGASPAYPPGTPVRGGRAARRSRRRPRPSG